MSQYNQENLPINFNPKVIFVVVLVLFGMIFVNQSYHIVEPGHTGIRIRLGKVIDAGYSEGLTWKVPFMDKFYNFNIQTQKLTIRAMAQSKDMQDVKSEIVLNYKVIESEASKIFKTIGVSYEDKVIEPALQESFKAVTANYPASELITERQAVRKEVEENITGTLLNLGIKLEALQIINFSFSQGFTEAIERKQVMEQDSERAENELKKVQFEQDQKLIKATADRDARIMIAQGEAEAIRIRAEAEAKALELLSVAAKPNALKARSIEKWDGRLPKVTSGAVPFIDVGRIANEK